LFRFDDAYRIADFLAAYIQPPAELERMRDASFSYGIRWRAYIASRNPKSYIIMGI
jgi:hypothetical protein